MSNKTTSNRRAHCCKWTYKRHAIYLVIAGLATTHVESALADETEVVPVENDVQVAEQRAAQAFEAYQAEKYPAAIALYLEAFNAARSADILYNIARIYDTKLGDRELAITFYRRYIAEPGAVAERIKQANECLVELREAEFAAREPASVSPNASSAKSGAGARNGPASAPNAQPDESWSTLKVTGAVVGAVGLVGVGVGTGFGFAALSDARVSRESCDGNACTTQEGVDATQDAKQKALISTIGFAAGGALLATGIVLFFSGGSSSTERDSTAQTVDGSARGGLRWGGSATSSSVALEVSGPW